MVFSSLCFLCLYLPAVLALYYILPKQLKNVLLLAASLLFYAWGEPRYILLMLFSIGFNYACGRGIEGCADRDRQTGKKLILILSLVANLGTLGFFKYTDFALTNLNRLCQTNFGLLKLALPIGISFYTFQTMSYVIDVYRGKVRAQKNIVDFGMYISLFPQLIAGPIVRYADIEPDLKSRTLSSDRFWKGLLRFSAGLGKKVLLANQIGSLWNEISGLSITHLTDAAVTTQVGAMPLLTAWLGAICYTFQIYFDFSGYSDMAIGLGEMLGFTFLENFDHPYESKSVTEFWRRWHISLSSWFREYLYIPLGGNRKGKGRQVLNLFIVWALTGLWHGADWNFLLWGIYYFALLLLEKLVFGRLLEKWPAILRHILTMVLVVVGWVIFACTDLNLLGNYLGSMIGLHGLWDSMSFYYLRTYGLLLLVLAVGSTGLPVKAVAKWKAARQPGEGVTWVLQTLFILAMLFLGILFLVGDSYNPFLYFRF